VLSSFGAGNCHASITTGFFLNFTLFSPFELLSHRERFVPPPDRCCS
jgi:hypothetical protein